MNALAFDTFGPPEVLRLCSLPEPVLLPGTLIVRMHFAGLNFADIYRRRGDYTLAGTAPHVLGYEGAGVVAAVGDGVSGFRVGDRVGFADVPHANAELVRVEADRAIALPATVSLEQAAALLLQGLTAQYLCEDSFAVQPGHRVLVHAAAGGVGRLLVQMCVRKGAFVHALASSETKARIAREAGAHRVSLSTGLWESDVRDASPDGLHAVFDSVGTTLERSLSVLRHKGRVVLFGFAGGSVPCIDPRRLLHDSTGVIGGDLWDYLDTAGQRLDRARRLFEALADGVITLPRVETFSLADGSLAHARLESRDAAGKIIFRIAPEAA